MVGQKLFSSRCVDLWNSVNDEVYHIICCESNKKRHLIGLLTITKLFSSAALDLKIFPISNDKYQINIVYL